MLTKALGCVALGLLLASATLYAMSLRPSPRAAVNGLSATGPVDLGTVDQGAVVPFRYRVENPSTAPITITGLTTSCGCTVLADVKGREVAPAASLAIDGTLDTHGRRGDFESHAILNYKIKPTDPARALMLSARVLVRPTLRAVPEHLIFGLESPSAVATQTIAIDSERIASATLIEATSSVFWLGVTITAPEFRKAGSVATPALLTVTIDREALARDDWTTASSDQSIRLRTSAEAEPSLTIPVHVRKP